MIRQMKGGLIFLSLGYFAVGLLLLIMPETSLRAICYAFGGIILITGVICLARYFIQRGKGLRAPLTLVAGVVTAALGVILLLQPDFVLRALPLVFGLFILLDGVIRIANSIELARAHGYRWWVLLLLGLVSVGMGLLVVLHPFDTIVSVTMLAGILLVIEGLMNLCCIIYAAMEMRTLTRVAEALEKAATTSAALPEQCDEGTDRNPEQYAGEPAPETDGDAPAQEDPPSPTLEV